MPDETVQGDIPKAAVKVALADTPVADTPVAVAADAPAEMLLEEFCSRLSGNDKRVELVNGFYYDEKQAGHIKGIESEFKARFAEFINKPV